MRWVFNSYASRLTSTCLISKQNRRAHIFRLHFAHVRMKEAVLMRDIPALGLPFLWELRRHKLCSSLLHSLFLQGQQEGLLVYTSTVTQSVTPNLCSGQFSCSCFETFGGKVSGLSAPTLCWVHSPFFREVINCCP